MKTTTGLCVAALGLSLFMIGSVNCGSSNGGAGGGTETGSTTAASGSTSTGAMTLSCTDFCAEVMKNCTGDELQYIDTTDCMNICKSFPVGKASDTSGDTLGCRTYHGGAPAAALPKVHCPHAGPSGGDGTCGTECDAYCDLELQTCASNYSSKSECMTECGKIKKDSPEAYTVPGAQMSSEITHLDCYLYHLSAASENAAAAMIHCPHSKPGLKDGPCEVPSN